MNLFVEVTHTELTLVNTGIQRVVRNVLRQLIEIGPQEKVNVFPVVFRGGAFLIVPPDNVLRNKMSEAADSPEQRMLVRKDKLKSLLRGPYLLLLKIISSVLPFEFVRAFIYAPTTRFGLAWLILLPFRVLRVLVRTVISTARRISGRSSEPSASASVRMADRVAQLRREDNVLLLLDSSWGYNIWPPIAAMKQMRLRVVSVMYDLVPLTHSNTSVAPLVRAFRNWLGEQFRHADRIICISRSVAEDLRSYLRKNAPSGATGRNIPISHFYLGSELDFVSEDDDVRPTIRAIADETKPLFLVVGTIEPRKNHRQIFEAFSKLWEQGFEARLVIVGARSWMESKLLRQIARHSELNRNLYLIRDASDSDVDWLYRNSDALIMASEAEGFGLPIVEARRRGLPVICSDIPVFREISAPGTNFFKLHDIDDLCRAVRDFVERDSTEDSGASGWITWRESTLQLLQEIRRMDSFRS